MLAQEYTRVSLELGTPYMPTAAEDNYMRAYWNRRYALAYLAATDQTWKDILIRKMSDAVANCMRRSKGAVMLDDFHWVSRPRACALPNH